MTSLCEKENRPRTETTARRFGAITGIERQHDQERQFEGRQIGPSNHKQRKNIENSPTKLLGVGERITERMATASQSVKLAGVS